MLFVYCAVAKMDANMLPVLVIRADRQHPSHVRTEHLRIIRHQFDRAAALLFYDSAIDTGQSCIYDTRDETSGHTEKLDSCESWEAPPQLSVNRSH